MERSFWQEDQAMKLNHMNLDEFKAILKTCRGPVTLITADGDRLIANSRFSSLIGLESLLAVAQRQDIRVSCSDPNDQRQVERYLLRHAQ